MKKLLALILALMMTVCIFAACGEKEEPVDETADVKALAEEALDLLVARDAEGLFTKMVDSDPTASANSALKGKLDAYDALITSFEAQVDGWNISDELKAEVKAYGKTKADAVLASFTAGEVTDAAKLGEVITVNAKANLLNVSGDAYKVLYTAPGAMAAYVGVECPEVKEVMTEEEAAAVTAADAEAKEKLASMTIDELKVVTDNIFAAVQECVVDTDVAFQYKKTGDAWKINYVGISAVE